MTLLDDIIYAATDEKVPIGTLLRKCLVLEQSFKNEKFKFWLNKELDGYDQEDELPSYRIFHAISYGHFIGSFGRQIKDQPLSLHVLERKDYEKMDKCPLNQPASSYEGRSDKTDDAQIPWNPALTAKYQTKFFQDKEMVLNRAWQLIPGSVLVALLESVRTRVLRFALDLKNNLGPNAPTVEKIPSATIERSVVNNIYGGNILIASQAESISQLSHTIVTPGNWDDLKNALQSVGVSDSGVAELKTAIKDDEKDGKPSIGPRVRSWLTSVGKYLGQAVGGVGIEVAKSLAKKWVLQHYGIEVDL
jgi:AbiTii